MRPIVVGLAGAVTTVLVARAWSRWVPVAFQSRSRQDLLAEYRWPVRLANLLFFLGIGAALVMYQFLSFARTDWRPLALGFGAGCVLAVLTLSVFAAVKGRGAREALVAFAIQQETPPAVLFGILAGGAVAFVLGVVGLVA